MTKTGRERGIWARGCGSRAILSRCRMKLRPGTERVCLGYLGFSNGLVKHAGAELVERMRVDLLGRERTDILPSFNRSILAPDFGRRSCM